MKTYQVEGSEEMLEIAFCEILVTTLAYDLTLYGPPAHVHLVCHLRVDPDWPSTPVHCEPEVASARPQRFYSSPRQPRNLQKRGHE